jgi:hypothetical protein
MTLLLGPMAMKNLSLLMQGARILHYYWEGTQNNDWQKYPGWKYLNSTIISKAKLQNMIILN